MDFRCHFNNHSHPTAYHIHTDGGYKQGQPGEWEDVYVGVDTEVEVKGLEPGIGRTYRVITVNMDNYKSEPSICTVAATLLPRMPVPKLVSHTISLYAPAALCTQRARVASPFA